MKMKRKMLTVGILLLSVLILVGCATTSWPRTEAGERFAVLGGIVGAGLDDDNPWRGGVIGVIAGALLSGMVENIAQEAARKAAAENAPVIFQRMNAERQVERIEATPVGVTADGTKVISVKHIVDGKVVKEEVKIIPPSPQ